MINFGDDVDHSADCPIINIAITQQIVIQVVHASVMLIIHRNEIFSLVGNILVITLKASMIFIPHNITSTLVAVLHNRLRQIFRDFHSSYNFFLFQNI